LLKPKKIKLSEQNQGTYAWYYSSAKVKSGPFPPLGGIKRRGPFLGTLAPVLTKEVGKQKGTKEQDVVEIK
jgi:hypothetical protein